MTEAFVVKDHRGEYVLVSHIIINQRSLVPDVGSGIPSPISLRRLGRVEKTT
ncbi:hypothetical protein DEO72_LG11g1528 [Vigna unguiculata]|uniref:Uncharacterized protein n=1 Tax=Vigna unguiculata TaxID=3917 RepID=A0A4D6NRW8_VIGUN|nr:hypothetical protein DEO72_LG11g1528 [Vigna unguiculata]